MKTELSLDWCKSFLNDYKLESLYEGYSKLVSMKDSLPDKICDFKKEIVIKHIETELYLYRRFKLANFIDLAIEEQEYLIYHYKCGFHDLVYMAIDFQNDANRYKYLKNVINVIEKNKITIDGKLIIPDISHIELLRIEI